jgi:hypothetical protein
MNNKIGKRYKTPLHQGHRPDLHPNGIILRCIEDMGDGFLVVTSDEDKEPNTWLISEKECVVVVEELKNLS